MPSATDDDDVVFSRGLGATPCLWPILMVADRVAGKAEDRISIFFSRAPQDARS